MHFFAIYFSYSLKSSTDGSIALRHAAKPEKREKHPARKEKNMDVSQFYQIHTEEVFQRKFTVNDIQAFVHHIFSLYERATCPAPYHQGVEVFQPLVDERVYVEFPDRVITGWEEFKEWHTWIHGELISDLHSIGAIDVEYLANGKYQAQFYVRWRAHYKTGEYVDQLMKQRWTMREDAQRPLPVLERDIVRNAEFLDFPRPLPFLSF